MEPHSFPMQPPQSLLTPQRLSQQHFTGNQGEAEGELRADMDMNCTYPQCSVLFNPPKRNWQLWVQSSGKLLPLMCLALDLISNPGGKVVP